MSGFAPLTDTTTGRSSKWDATSSAAHVNLTTLISGENQTLNATATYNATVEYVSGAFVTTGTAVTLGSVGAAGDLLETVWIYNGSASAFTAFTITDGTTVLDFLTPGMTTLGAGAYGVYQIPGGPLASKNGAWKITATCAGTMTLIKYGAKGLFS